MKVPASGKACFGQLLLASTVAIGGVFGYWLIAERDYEKVHRIFIKHDYLVTRGKRKEAHALFNEALSAEGDDPLDPIWLPLVRTQQSKYVQLKYFVQILAGDPEREATYEEIANLLETAPDAFNNEVKPRYLSDLAAISGVQTEFLEKYGLILNGVQEAVTPGKLPN